MDANEFAGDPSGSLQSNLEEQVPKQSHALSAAQDLAEQLETVDATTAEFFPEQSAPVFHSSIRSSLQQSSPGQLPQIRFAPFVSLQDGLVPTQLSPSQYALISPPGENASISCACSSQDQVSSPCSNCTLQDKTMCTDRSCQYSTGNSFGEQLCPQVANGVPGPPPPVPARTPVMDGSSCGASDHKIAELVESPPLETKQKSSDQSSLIAKLSSGTCTVPTKVEPRSSRQKRVAPYYLSSWSDIPLKLRPPMKRRYIDLLNPCPDTYAPSWFCDQRDCDGFDEEISFLSTWDRINRTMRACPRCGSQSHMSSPVCTFCTNAMESGNR